MIVKETIQMKADQLMTLTYIVFLDCSSSNPQTLAYQLVMKIIINFKG